MYKSFNNIEEFNVYIKSKKITREIKKIIVHQLWQRKGNTFWGQKSLTGLDEYYKKKGKGRGFHFCIGKGKIWEFLDLNQQADQAVIESVNCNSLAIEVDSVINERKPSPRDWKLFLKTINSLMQLFKIEPNMLFLHKEFHDTPCTDFEKEYLLSELNKIV